MSRYAPKQLSLLDSFEEGTSLREDLNSLQQTVTWQRTKITALHDELAHANDQLSSAHNAWETVQQALEQTRTQLTLARAEAKQWRLLYEICRPVASPPSAAVSTLPRIDHELRQLLVIAHPDRWSQGQPATELAHEVASALNTLRQRLGEVT